MTPSEYDMAVVEATTEICKQVFPITLAWDHPSFKKGLDRLFVISEKLGRLRSEPGLAAKAQRAALSTQAAATFLRLLAMPGRRAPLPAEIRLAPAY